MINFPPVAVVHARGDCFSKSPRGILGLACEAYKLDLWKCSELDNVLHWLPFPDYSYSPGEQKFQSPLPGASPQWHGLQSKEAVAACIPSAQLLPSGFAYKGWPANTSILTVTLRALCRLILSGHYHEEGTGHQVMQMSWPLFLIFKCSILLFFKCVEFSQC